jgi:hypothetical protein
MESEENRTQVRAPLQFIAWGSPIIIGLLVSGKLSSAQIAMAVGILLGASILIYFALRSGIVSRIKLRGPSFTIWAILICIPVYIYIFFMLGSIALQEINEAVIKSRMDIALGPPEGPVTPNSEVNVPFSLYYDHETPAVGVSVRLESPGIIQSLKGIYYNALTSNQAQTGSFLVSIPNDIPQGVYQMELNVSYTAGAWIDFPFFHGRQLHRETDSIELVVE